MLALIVNYIFGFILLVVSVITSYAIVSGKVNTSENFKAMEKRFGKKYAKLIYFFSYGFVPAILGFKIVFLAIKGISFFG